MTNQSHGGGAQSIGTQGEQPVDGIAGSNPGTQQPSGADVNAGKIRHGAPGNQQHAITDDEAAPARTGSFASQGRGKARPGQGKDETRPRADSRADPHADSGAGSALQGGSGDSMQGGANARGQNNTEPGHAGAPAGTLQRGGLVQSADWNSGN